MPPCFDQNLTTGRLKSVISISQLSLEAAGLAKERELRTGSKTVRYSDSIPV
ncbi:MAG TPA: hypothetical protein VKA68_17335 [bacterium]|nr:hypothetical protein [bacterium]